MAARDTSPTKPTNNEELILYRLGVVEEGVKSVNGKFDRLSIIRPSDLVEFKDTILSRIDEIRDDFNDKITSVDRRIEKLEENKANKTELTDIKKLIGAVGAVFGAIIAGLAVAYFTRPR